jgi:hypothetical protein
MLRCFCVLVATLTLQGCSMLNSASIPENVAAVSAGEIACQSEAGAYHLSKAFFRVKVNIVAVGGKPVAKMDNVVVNYRPDRTKGYCLDYASSPTAHDRVKVFKVKAGRQLVDKANPKVFIPDSELAASGSDLLHAISTDAIDESAYIAKTLVRTLFVGLTGNPQFALGSGVRALNPPATNDETRALDVEYDPFNLPQAALINKTLSEFGFCIVVQGITLGSDGETLNSYCDDPMSAAQRQSHFATTLLSAEAPAHVSATRGILYRPRIPYTVLLLIKPNKKVKGGWEIRGSEVVPLENISPVLAVNVDRAFFADRRTSLLFNQGALTNICVAKTSEIKGFIDVPLEVAKSIVAIPANIVQVRIDNTNGRKSLLAAENALLKAQIKQMQLEQAVTQEEIDAALAGASPNPVHTPVKRDLTTLGALLEAQLLENGAYTAGFADIYGEFAADGMCPSPQSITAGAN